MTASVQDLETAGRAQAEADFPGGNGPSAYWMSRQPDAYRRGYRTRKHELHAEAAGGNAMTTAQDGKQVRRRITVYEPLSMIAAEHGWRAAFTGRPGDDGPGYVAEPLIGWGIFDVTERPAAGQTGPTHHHGRQVHGIVALEDEVNAAPAAAANFWRYLAPGDELTDAEVTAEQEARAGHWKGQVR